mmetsp:Transcript_9321/g.28779  ORF Transcript_9321/g.28779 Transcript_9321/m.28779 type:complete len:728 (+) Transcript_9321:132-2315(+)|eukprot:CAMPEP_0177647958 /NCGR_PEP_ID=MMETSP0447-20121125/10574_1 /TAXON_ID=0 /ORGANISM="Stygamoeba regulata, Strain BSH-02190019" /LENGTH=727 /DNA_ID=CAMNT_0019150571 /DNA_START=56 /DNA_END=2239 /DNA_ORIENTATION=+
MADAVIDSERRKRRNSLRRVKEMLSPRLRSSGDSPRSKEDSEEEVAAFPGLKTHYVVDPQATVEDKAFLRSLEEKESLNEEVRSLPRDESDSRAKLHEKGAHSHKTPSKSKSAGAAKSSKTTTKKKSTVQKKTNRPDTDTSEEEADGEDTPSNSEEAAEGDASQEATTSGEAQSDQSKSDRSGDSSPEAADKSKKKTTKPKKQARKPEEKTKAKSEKKREEESEEEGTEDAEEEPVAATTVDRPKKAGGSGISLKKGKNMMTSALKRSGKQKKKPDGEENSPLRKSSSGSLSSKKGGAPKKKEEEEKASRKLGGGNLLRIGKKKEKARAHSENKHEPRDYVYTTNGKFKLTDPPLPEDAQLDKRGNPKSLKDFPKELVDLLTSCGIDHEALNQSSSRDVLINIFKFLRINSHLKYTRSLGTSSHSSFTPEEEEQLVRPALPSKLLKITNDELGVGAFGKVFRAKVLDKKMKVNTIAVKILPYVTEKQKASNINELRFLSRCNHENIVKYYDSYVVGKELWVILENMEGGTLREGAQDYKEHHIAYIARAIFRALQYMHDELKIVHRDLKSENIMMTVKGEVKLIDFGLAEDISEGGRVTMCGSPFWMAPEMVKLRRHSTPADIWGAAISLLELANQEPPTMDDPVLALYKTATTGCTNYFKTPERWSDVFHEFLGLCLKRDPSKRATAAELLTHPFLKKACPQKEMREVFETVFLRDTLRNAGLDFL